MDALRSSTRPATAPSQPEPLRWAGGSVVLAALRRKEAAEERGARADPVTCFVADLPRRMGITVGR
jgi:hypothetical protein